jgi:solute carrier family 15 oligopeptide transporter 1
LAKNPHAIPRAIYYILPNEFGERFTFYGAKALLVRYLSYIGATKEHAKVMVHAWSMVRTVAIRN